MTRLKGEREDDYYARMESEELECNQRERARLALFSLSQGDPVEKESHVRLLIDRMESDFTTQEVLASLIEGMQALAKRFSSHAA